MIPLPAGAFTDQQTLPETRVLLRRSLADAERALERADWLVEQLADLPRVAAPGSYGRQAPDPPASGAALDPLTQPCGRRRPGRVPPPPPYAALLPDTARLLSEQRRLAERRVSRYRTALNAVEQAIRER